MRSGSRFKPIRVRPADGGQLLTSGISAEMVGLHNYTIKQDWRRDQQDEIRREGFDLFHPNLAIPIGTQPFPEIQNLSGTTTAHGATTITGVGTAFLVELEVGDRIALSSSPGAYVSVLAIESNVSLTVNTGIGDGSAQGIIVKRTEPITLLHMARQPNGRTAQIAGTPTTLYRYQALEDGKYFEDFDNPGYFEDPVLGPNLVADGVYDGSGVFSINLDNAKTYFLIQGVNEDQTINGPDRFFTLTGGTLTLFGTGASIPVTASVQASNTGEPYFFPTSGTVPVVPTGGQQLLVFPTKVQLVDFSPKIGPVSGAGVFLYVEFVDDGSIIGNNATASFDLPSGVLTVLIKSGVTTRQKVEDAIRAGAPVFLNRGTSAAGNSISLANLLGWWSLDETTSTTKSDASGNANHLNLLNGDAQLPGKIGQSLSVATFNNVVGRTLNASLSLAATDSFTISGWIKVNGFSGTGHCYLITQASGIPGGFNDRRPFAIFLNGPNSIQFFRWTNNFTVPQSITADIPADSQWIHVVASYNNATSTIRLRINNGVAVTANAPNNTSVLSSTGALWIGNDPGNIESFNGQFDEVSFWRRAITTTEEDAHWNGGVGVAYADAASGGVISVRTGVVVFTTQAALGFIVGTQAVIRSASSPWLWMKGQIRGYAGTSLTVNVTEISKVAGSTAAIDWTINAENASGFDVQGSDYFVPTDVGTSYFERTGVGEPYFDLGIGVWRIIGRGFNPNASRWEAVNLNGWTVLNNGKNLPVTYRVEEEEAVPIHELRENGVAYVGTISEFNGILLCADVGQIKDSSLAAVFKHIASGSITASQAGAATSGLVTATQVGVTAQILSSSAFFAAGNVGKTIQFSNGFKSVILSFQDTTHITLTDAPTVVGATPMTFYIIDLAASYLVIASAPYFTAGMVGRSLYFPSGVTRLVTSFVDAATVSTDSFLPVAASTFLLENVTAYGEVSDSLVDRIQYRMLWGMPGLPRRFAAVASGSMTAGSYILELDYPIKSFSIGQQITVVGAGLLGNTLTATIIWIAPNRTTLSLSSIADTDVTSVLVQASDASGSMVGFEDLQDDGSAIIRMLPLKNLLAIYKDTSIFLASYTGLVAAPFNFGQQGPVYRGEASIAYRNTLVKVGDQVHLYAGRNSFWTFDLISRVPKLYTLGNQIRNLFFSRATLAQTHLIFAADNAITKEITFFFPDTAQLVIPPTVPVEPPVTPFPPLIVLGEEGVALGEGGFGLI